MRGYGQNVLWTYRKSSENKLIFEKEKKNVIYQYPLLMMQVIFRLLSLDIEKTARPMRKGLPC